jgi:hypothetical protein
MARTLEIKALAKRLTLPVPLPRRCVPQSPRSRHPLLLRLLLLLLVAALLALPPLLAE